MSFGFAFLFLIFMLFMSCIFQFKAVQVGQPFPAIMVDLDIAPLDIGQRALAQPVGSADGIAAVLPLDAQADPALDDG